MKPALLAIFLISLPTWAKSISITKLKPASIQYRINPFLSDCRGLLEASPIARSSVRILPSDNEGSGKWLDISVRLAPRLRMAISAGKIYFRDAGKLIPEAFSEKNIDVPANDQGILSISIPFVEDESEMRIPLKFTAEDGAVLSAYLRVKIVSEEELSAVLVPIIDIERQKGLCMRSQAWLGLGYSMFAYDQSIPQMQASAKFTSLSPFSLSSEVKIFASPTWAFVAGFKSAPGHVSTGAIKNISATDFRWNTALIETQYRPYAATVAYGEYTLYPFVKLGLQNHRLPRLAIDTNDNISFDSVNLLNGHVGIGINVVDRGKYFLEIYTNYQTKLSSVGYNLSPSLMFDGSIGVGRMMTKQLALGIFSYGQWHQFDYQAKSGSDTNSGHINYFFSNLDARIGWAF